MAKPKSDQVARLKRLSKTELSQFFQVSLTAVDRWLIRGCPVVQKGGSGRQYRFNALDVIRWRFEREHEDRTEATTDPDHMTPAGRLAWMRAERELDTLRERRQELVEVGDHQAVVGYVRNSISEFLETLPEVITERAKLTPSQAAAVESVVNAQRQRVKR